MTNLPTTVPWTWGNRLLGYNGPKRRVWILGQRIHHGPVGCAFVVLGAILVLHDRKDAPIWFVRGLGALEEP